MSNPLVTEIEKIAKSKPVVIFLKGTADFPQCGFSARAVQVLKMAGANEKEIESFDVLSNDPMWDALEEYTKWPTVPQIFINGQFIGGCDIVTEMYERGELAELMSAK